MLDDNGIAFEYREYREDPLSRQELEAVFSKLGLRPKEALRVRDRANQDVGLSGEESDDVLLAAMAEHPTLLQRPIGVLGDRAVLGRPPDRLLELVGK